MSLTSLENEAERIATLNGCGLLDTLPEARFDSIVALAATLTKTPMAAFTLVDTNRVWFKSRFGIDAEEASPRSLLCAHTVSLGKPLVLEDAAADERFAQSDIVAQEPHIRYYTGVPVRAENGHALGSLCVLDTAPRKSSEQDIELLQCLAREIEANLALRASLKAQQELAAERAMLADMILHEAGGIGLAMRWDLKRVADGIERASPALNQCRAAVEDLIKLCSGVLESAESHLSLVFHPTCIDARAWWKTYLRRVARRERESGLLISATNDLPQLELQTDYTLLERVMNSLLDHAIKQSSPHGEIKLSARLDGNRLVLGVADQAARSSVGEKEKIFSPYRTELANAGLGLAIGWMAVRALGGQIEIVDRDGRGRILRVRVPVDTPARTTS